MRLWAVAAFDPGPGMPLEMPLKPGDAYALVDQLAPEGWLWVESEREFYTSTDSAWKHWPLGSVGLVPASYLEVLDDGDNILNQSGSGHASNDDDGDDDHGDSSSTSDREEGHEEVKETEEKEQRGKRLASANVSAPGASAVATVDAWGQHSPGGLFAATSGICGRNELRARCSANQLPLSISDSWQSLDMRLQMDAAICEAQRTNQLGYDAAEALLQCPPLLATSGAFMLVRGSWLRTQDSSSLAHHDGITGIMPLEEMRANHRQHGPAQLPVVTLRDVWDIRAVDAPKAAQMLELVIEALHAVAEKRQRIAHAHAQKRAAQEDHLNAAEDQLSEATARVRAAENWSTRANAQLLEAKRLRAESVARRQKAEARAADAIATEQAKRPARFESTRQGAAEIAIIEAEDAREEEKATWEDVAVKLSAVRARRQAEHEAHVTLEAAVQFKEQAQTLLLPATPPGDWADVLVLLPRAVMPPPSTSTSPAEPASPRTLLASLRRRCRANLIEWSISDSARDLEERLRDLAQDYSWQKTTRRTVPSFSERLMRSGYHGKL